MDARRDEETVKIFSITNGYSNKIYSKEKSVELRRQNVKISKNEKCLIYTTSPIKEITGYFIVKQKIRLPIKNLWETTKNFAGLSKSEFMKYFKGCKHGTAIFFKYVKKFVRGLGLEEIRALIIDFRPPQSYYNLNNKIYSIISIKLGQRPINLGDF